MAAGRFVPESLVFLAVPSVSPVAPSVSRADGFISFANQIVSYADQTVSLGVVPLRREHRGNLAQGTAGGPFPVLHWGSGVKNRGPSPKKSCWHFCLLPGGEAPSLLVVVKMADGKMPCMDRGHCSGMVCPAGRYASDE